MALRFVTTRDGRRALAHYGISATMSVATVFVVSVGPEHWGRTACDAIAINSAATAIVSPLGLAIVARVFRDSTAIARAAGVLAAAAGVFIAIEPQCLEGPFAMMDPLVRSIWFVHVSEMQPLWAVARHSLPMAAAVAAFPRSASCAPVACRNR